MTIKIIAVIFFLSFGRALSQCGSIYVGSNSPDLTYDKTRQEIMHNFLSNKPLLNYVPVYNTDYGNWDAEKQQEDPANPNNRKSQATNSDMDFEKFSEVIIRLKNNMQSLSHKTKHIYEDKLKELNEVKKLYENLRVALQNTDTLKNSIQQHTKQLNEITKNPEKPAREQVVNPERVDQYLKGIEGLESMVRNINYKYDEKLGM